MAVDCCAETAQQIDDGLVALAGVEIQSGHCHRCRERTGSEEEGSVGPVAFNGCFAFWQHVARVGCNMEVAAVFANLYAEAAQNVQCQIDVGTGLQWR